MHWIDPDSLPSVKSKVDRFLFNPKGDADAMLLTNGMEAHFPPHLSKEVLEHIQPGDAATLFGVKPRGTDMIACIAIESVRGRRIDDNGPSAKKTEKTAPKKNGDADDDHLTRVEVEDTIERHLHGPKGEVRGVLLAGGSIVRFPPHIARGSDRKLLTPGAVLAVRGEARPGSNVTVIEARGLGRSKVQIKPLDPKPHR